MTIQCLRKPMVSFLYEPDSFRRTAFFVLIQSEAIALELVGVKAPSKPRFTFCGLRCSDQPWVLLYTHAAGTQQQ